MRIWDRYILRTFCSYFFLLLIAFTVLFVIVDLVETLDSFIDSNASILKIALYYVYYIPYILVLVLPVAVVVSGSLACGFMSRHREIMAVNTSGISKQRAGVYVLSFGLLLSVTLLIFANLIVPYANSRKNQLKQEIVKPQSHHKSRIKKDILYRGKEGVIIFLHRYNPTHNKGQGAVVQKLVDNKVSSRYDARSFYFLSDSLVLEDGIKRVFLNQDKEESEEFKRRTFYVEIPSEILKGEKPSENLTTPELSERVSKMESWGLNPVRDKVDYWMRFFFPFSVFVLLLFVIPFSLRFRKYGFFIGFGQGLATAFIYYGLIRALQTAGYNEVLSPSLASSLPTLIFLSVGAYFYLAQR